MSVILAIIGAVLLGVAVWTGIEWRRRRNGRIKQAPFLEGWKELQKFCAHKETWPSAITQADELLNRALKKRRFKGKSMGERLVSAQRSLSDNDGIWSSHNLAKKLKEGKAVRLSERQVKQALINFRQAMRDIGALPND